VPTNRSVLFWSSATRNAAFRAVDRLGFLAKSRDIVAGTKRLVLPVGKPLSAAPPDTRCHYSAGETKLIGVPGKGYGRSIYLDDHSYQ
jgi:hypothetical protein